MLSPPDAGVVRRDPALPGLATLLDPDALLDALRNRMPGSDLRRATSHYIRYKPQTTCLAAYRLETSHGPLQVYAKAYRPNDQGKFRKQAAAMTVTAESGPAPFLLDDLHILVCPFANDIVLQALPLLADEQGRSQVLRRVLPDRLDLWEAGLCTLAYKPERRYVARLDVGGNPQAAIKLYSASGFRRMSRSAKLLGSGTTPRVPRRLGRSERYCVMALEWLPGCPLMDVLSSPALDVGAIESVGRALAELHAQGGGKLEPLSREAEAAGLLRLADGLAELLEPQCVQEARRIARHLAVRLAERPAPTSCTHGDFHQRQVILDSNSVAILDTDEAVRGDSAEDLGNFLAHLERDVLADRLPPGRMETTRTALAHGYQSGGGHWDEDGVRLYVAAGLLRLAPHPFREREQDWPERTADLLRRSLMYLGTDTL